MKTTIYSIIIISFFIQCTDNEYGIINNNCENVKKCLDIASTIEINDILKGYSEIDTIIIKNTFEMPLIEGCYHVSSKAELDCIFGETDHTFDFDNKILIGQLLYFPIYDSLDIKRTVFYLEEIDRYIYFRRITIEVNQSYADSIMNLYQDSSSVPILDISGSENEFSFISKNDWIVLPKKSNFTQVAILKKNNKI